MNRISSRLLVPCLAIAVACVVAGPALAGKTHGGGGTGSGSASISLVPLYSHSGGPAVGDTVTFSVSASSAFPYVRVDCSQGGVVVYSQTNGFFSTYPWGQNYQLGPTTSWKSGSASCKAVVFINGLKGSTTLASLPFTVSG